MKLKANAKVNLSLDVSFKRQDGYHIIDSVMQSVSLCDRVEIEKAQDLTVWYSDIGTPNDNDICLGVARKFFEYANINEGAKISIEKNIPCVAGIGGSSSDAAAVLIALNELYGTRLPKEKLCEIGLRVGADIPFCVVGGTCRVGGIGEIITPINPIKGCAFLIVVLGKKPSTKEMYSILDLNFQKTESTPKVIKAIQDNNLSDMCKNLSNAFEMVQNIVHERTLLSRFDPIGIGLSGSGPAVFAIFDNEDRANSAKAQLKKEGIESFVALPTESGIEIE